MLAQLRVTRGNSQPITKSKIGYLCPQEDTVSAEFQTIFSHLIWN